MATPLWAAIKADIRNRLGEPTAGYWTDAELTDWYNEAIQLQHRMIWQAVAALEDRAYTEALENDYCRLFLAKSGAANLAAGTADYAFPTGFWRAVRVTITVDSVECPCDYVPFADDWDVRTLPHRMPTPTRPKYTITPEAKIRFYVTPGKKTVPNATNAYSVYFMKQPVTVVDVTTDTTVVDPFNAAPKEWVCYKASLKQFDGGEQYLAGFAREMQVIVPGPSKEAAEKKVVNVTKNYYGAGAGG